MVLKCDKKSERRKNSTIDRKRIGNISLIGNVVMKSKNKILEKYATEVIKIKHRTDHCEEYLQHRCGEKWDLIETEARDSFSSSSTRMIKCAVGINHYRERINKIDKKSTTSAFHVCGTDEDWEHEIA